MALRDQPYLPLYVQDYLTPEKLADELVEIAELEQHDTILEPSAGQGAIIKAN